VNETNMDGSRTTWKLVGLVVLFLAGPSLGAQAPTGPATQPDASPATRPATAQASVEDKALPPSHRPVKPSDEDRPLKVGGGDQAWDWVRTGLALGLVVVLIFLTRGILRRLGGPVRVGRRQVIEVLARTSVSPKQQLLLVRLGSRLVLVGVGPSGMAALSEVRDPGEVHELMKATGAAGDGDPVEARRPPLRRFDRAEAREAERPAQPPGEPRLAGVRPPGQTVRDVTEKVRQKLAGQGDRS
jgi:flagellar biogenesis protein FliO